MITEVPMPIKYMYKTIKRMERSNRPEEISLHISELLSELEDLTKHVNHCYGKLEAAKCLPESLENPWSLVETQMAYEEAAVRVKSLRKKLEHNEETEKVITVSLHEAKMMVEELSKENADLKVQNTELARQALANSW